MNESVKITLMKKSRELSPEALEFFRRNGARGGKLGAKARMEKLTPEQRSEIARNAVAGREAKRAAKRAKEFPR
jgi:hypothetical protein